MGPRPSTRRRRRPDRRPIARAIVPSAFLLLAPILGLPLVIAAEASPPASPARGTTLEQRQHRDDDASFSASFEAGTSTSGAGMDDGGGARRRTLRTNDEEERRRGPDDRVDVRRSCKIASCDCDGWERLGVKTRARRPWLRERFVAAGDDEQAPRLAIDGVPPGGDENVMPTDGSSREDMLYNSFLKYCGCKGDESHSEEESCAGYIPEYLAMARRHRSFVDAAERAHAGDVRDASNDDERPNVLVVRSDWHVLGLGHMAPTAAAWMMLALVSKRLIFFDNRDAKYDWLDYFEAWFGEEAPGLNLAFTPAVEAHLQRLGYAEQLDTLGAEVHFHEGAPTLKTPVRCNKGHCRSNFFCTKGEMDMLNEKEMAHEARSVELEQWAIDAGLHTKGEGEQSRSCTEKMKKSLCALGTIPSWECEPCFKCVSDHMEAAPWVTIAGAGVKPPPIAPLAAEPMYDERLKFWDKIAEQAGTEKLLATLRGSKDRCIKCSIYALIRPKFFTAQAAGRVSVPGPLAGETAGARRLTSKALGQRRPHPNWVSFFRSPYAATGSSRGLACVKVRTGYAENKMCFPDVVKRTHGCMEGVYAFPPCAVAYVEHMAIRLQYDPENVKRTHEGRSMTGQRALARRRGVVAGGVQTNTVPIYEAIDCMTHNLRAEDEGYEAVKGTRQRWAPKEVPFVHLITDTPALQRYFTSTRVGPNVSAPTVATAIHGVGVDLTNAYRGDQDNRTLSKWKVAFDYYLQAWCHESVTLSPSEFYASSMERALALDPPVVVNTCVDEASSYTDMKEPTRQPRELSRDEKMSMIKFWKECAVDTKAVHHDLTWARVFDFGYDVIDEVGTIVHVGRNKVGDGHEESSAGEPSSAHADSVVIADDVVDAETKTAFDKQGISSMVASYVAGIFTAWVVYALVQRRRRIRGIHGGARSPTGRRV